MKTALITGASSGLGAEFVKQITEKFPKIEQYVLIARRADRLEKMKEELGGGIKVITAVLDLADENSFGALSNLLARLNPELELVINNAGVGYWGAAAELSTEKQTRMCDVNVRAVVAVTRLSLQYMRENSAFIYISSIASFVPNAYMSVYSATKFFVTAYARALRYELKPRRIKVSAVCPGPMNTEFISVGGVQSKKFQRLPYCNPKKVVSGALKASKRGKFLYTNRLVYKTYAVLSKILPHNWLMGAAKT